MKRPTDDTGNALGETLSPLGSSSPVDIHSLSQTQEMTMDNPKYLYMRKLNGAAHLWDDDDTYCRMYSTGGLKKDKYQVHAERGNRRICNMCNNVFEQYSGYRITDVD